MREIRSWKKVLVNDLDSIVYELKECIDCPAVVILSGDVGAGKTTFTKAFVQAVSEDKNPTATASPTYSLINESGSVVHADFYRLKNVEEITHLEIPLYLEDKDYFLVEWGRPYLASIRDEVSDDYAYYELKIDVNPLSEGQAESSRNFFLESLDS